MREHLQAIGFRANQISKTAGGLHCLAELLAQADPSQKPLASLLAIMALQLDEAAGHQLSEIQDAAPDYDASHRD